MAKLSSCRWLWSWKTCSQCLPFKQTAHDRVRLNLCKSPHSRFINTACRWQETYSPPLLEPLWALFSTSTVLQLHIVQLMRLRRGWWLNIINYSPVNTSCTDLQMPTLNTVCVCWVYCFQIKLFFPFRQRHQCHIYSSDLMKFIQAVGADQLFSFARSQCAYPNRATASFHAARNFLTERSHHLSWHTDDLDISGNQT